MNLDKLIAMAKRLELPDLVARGVYIATDVAAFAEAVKANAARAVHVLSDGERADLDAIHAEALAAADALDAELAAAAKR